MSALEARFDRLHPRRHLLNGAKKLGGNRHQTSPSNSKSWKKAQDKLVKTNANEPVIKKKELEIMKRIKDLENVKVSLKVDIFGAGNWYVG